MHARTGTRGETGAQVRSRTQGSRGMHASVVLGRRGAKKRLLFGDEPCFAGRKLELWSTKVGSLRSAETMRVQLIRLRLPASLNKKFQMQMTAAKLSLTFRQSTALDSPSAAAPASRIDPPSIAAVQNHALGSRSGCSLGQTC